MNNDAPSLPEPRLPSHEDRVASLLGELAAGWREATPPLPAPFPAWLLRKLEARLQHGTRGGDGIAEALPEPDSVPAELVPAMDTLEAEALLALLDRRLLDRDSLAAVHAVFSEARAELASRSSRSVERALAARDHQLSVATHELRTPISSILLNLQLLERTARARETLDGEAVVRMLAVPARQLRRLIRMVDLLLDTAQVENERLALDPAPLDLCELVHDVARRLEELARATGCTLDLSDCQPVQGQWDRLRLEQVVHNLLTNGIKYGGGRVEVHTYQDGDARIVVRDGGRGIAAEDHERIFEPYERVHGDGSEEGAGLGLYIVREIVRAHGGRIAVDSQAGQGAAFVVTLPLAPTGGRQVG